MVPEWGAAPKRVSKRFDCPCPCRPPRPRISPSRSCNVTPFSTDDRRSSVSSRTVFSPAVSPGCAMWRCSAMPPSIMSPTNSCSLVSFRSAAPKHGCPVGDLEYLLHAVRDKDEGHASSLPLTDELEEPLDLPPPQTCGGLIQNHDARLATQCLKDLHNLSVTGREG